VREVAGEPPGTPPCWTTASTGSTAAPARRPSPLWWFPLAIGLVVGLACGVLDPSIRYSADGAQWMRFVENTWPGWIVALGCAGYLATVRRRFDPRGSAAFALAAAALVTVLAQLGELLFALDGYLRLAQGRFWVFACLAAALGAFTVVLATIGMRRYWSLPRGYAIE
jgi:hypothetical protein